MQAKTHGTNPTRLLSEFFFQGPDPSPPDPAGPVKGLSPIRGPTKKKIEAQIYFCHIQPAFSNSSLDNMAQMPSPTKKRKKELKPKFTYHQQQQQFLDSLSSQQKNTSFYIFSYPNFLCSYLIQENFKNGVQAFGYHTLFGQGLESFLQDEPVHRRFDP